MVLFKAHQSLRGVTSGEHLTTKLPSFNWSVVEAGKVEAELQLVGKSIEAELQLAALSIYAVETSPALALKVAAPRVEWAKKMLVSIPAEFNTVFN